MVNGAPTAITAAATGTATQCSDVAHSVSVNAGDIVTIKLVTSGGSTVVAHIVTIAIRS